MALIIPPGYLQAVYAMSLAGDTELMVVTCGHEIDGPSGANSDDAANDLFTSFALEVFAPRMSNDYTLEYVTVYIGQDGPTLVNISDETPVAGTIASDTVPQNTATLVRKRTDLGGRRGRGRLYLPGVPETEVNAVGTLTPAYVSAHQAAFDDWHTYLTAGVGARLYPPVILHRSEGIGTEPPPTPIARFAVESRVATQRRRLRP